MSLISLGCQGNYAFSFLVGDPGVILGRHQVEQGRVTLPEHPQNPGLLLSEAACHAKLQQWDRTEACYRRAAAIAPKSTLPLQLLLGDLNLQKGLTAPAIEEFNKLIQEQPANASAREVLGRALLETGRYADAIEMFQKAIQLRPDSAAAHYYAGNAAQALKQYADAAAHYRQALDIVPRTPRYQLALAGACELQGDNAGALAVYDEMLATNPDDAVALNEAAYLCTTMKQNLPRALTLARHAAELYPDNPHILDTLGAVYIENHQPTDAIPVLQRAVKIAPERGIAYYHLGKALLVSGRHNESLGVFQIALARGLPAAEKADVERLLASR